MTTETKPLKLPKPMFGISRLDQEEKHNHGYQVRVTHKGLKVGARFFPDKSLGGPRKALAAAKAYRDEVVQQHPEVLDRALKKPRKVPQSEVPGVTHVRSSKGGKYFYWQAAWFVKGLRKTRKFSILRFGDAKAKELAEEFGALSRAGKHKEAKALLSQAKKDYPRKGGPEGAVIKTPFPKTQVKVPKIKDLKTREDLFAACEQLGVPYTKKDPSSRLKSRIEKATKG